MDKKVIQASVCSTQRGGEDEVKPGRAFEKSSWKPHKLRILRLFFKITFKFSSERRWNKLKERLASLVATL